MTIGNALFWILSLLKIRITEYSRQTNGSRCVASKSPETIHVRLEDKELNLKIELMFYLADFKIDFLTIKVLKNGSVIMKRETGREKPKEYLVSFADFGTGMSPLSRKARSL